MSETGIHTNCLLLHPLTGQLHRFKKPIQFKWSDFPPSLNLDFIAVWSAVMTSLNLANVVSSSSSFATCTPWKTSACTNSANLGPGLKVSTITLESIVSVCKLYDRIIPKKLYKFNALCFQFLKAINRRFNDTLTFRDVAILFLQKQGKLL